MIWSIVISVISVILVLCIGYVQISIFRRTKRNLLAAKGFFPENDDYIIFGEDDGIKRISTTARGDINSLIDELNQYLKSNKGTADFSIMQNKTERRTDAIIEQATARVSFPTYIGLIGTFLGVLIGLIGFLIGGEDSGVKNLVIGVIISMTTSFLGLILTTYGNHLSAKAKDVIDERKNEFYDFLQNRLMPSLGTSMVAALNTLKNTLGSFKETFSSVISEFESSFHDTIKLFKKTFDECTVNFGNEFRDNSVLLNQGVDKMSHSVELINSNVDNQRQLLEEIRSSNMWDTLNKFVEVSGILEQSAKHIEGLRDVGKMIEEQVLSLMTAQEEYTKSLAIPKVLTERINNLLDRVSTFEKNINNLGVAIGSTELLGTKEMQDIQKHLDRISKQNFLAEKHADTQSHELEKFFEAQRKSIGELNERYHRLMEEHGEKLAEVMDAAIKSLNDKKEAFLRAIDEAFDVAKVNTQFSHLETLPRLESALKKLEEQLSAEHAEMVGIAAKSPTREDMRPLNSLVKIESSVSSIEESSRNNNESLDYVREKMSSSDLDDRLQQLVTIGNTLADIVAKTPTREDMRPLNSLVKIESSVSSIEESSRSNKESLDCVKEKISSTELNERLQQLVPIENTLVDIRGLLQNTENSAPIENIRSETVKPVSANNKLRKSVDEKSIMLHTEENLSTKIETKSEPTEKQVKTTGTKGRKQVTNNEE